MYRTMKKADDGLFHSACPECGEEVIAKAGDKVVIQQGCEHAVRTWRVAATGRVRIEYRVAAHV